MPIYNFRCDKCALEIEKVQGMNGDAPCCPNCGAEMHKAPTSPAIVRIMSKGGIPIRSKGYKAGYSKEYLRDVSPETQG